MSEVRKKRYWGKTLVAFFVVLCSMPLGHALMVLMEAFLEASALHHAAFLMGFVGLVIVIVGVFIRGDVKQTLCGLFGGLLYWVGWIEFLFQYYANRWGTQPDIDEVTGEVVSKPEYVIMPATFGLFMMFMVLYLFTSRTGCCFLNWCQRRIFRTRRELLPPPPRRHTSVTTFLELNIMMWACYLVLMFCYDKEFLGDKHPVTFGVGFVCLLSAVYMFIKELHIGAWGANIRMAIATVIIFWTPVEILMRNDFATEIWVEPQKYRGAMYGILAVFVVLIVWIIVAAALRKRSAH